jgi:hypothetical protein
MGIATVIFRRVMGHRLGVVGTASTRSSAGDRISRSAQDRVARVGRREYLIVGTTATDLVPLGRLTDSTQLHELLTRTTETTATPTSSLPDSVFCPGFALASRPGSLR